MVKTLKLRKKLKQHIINNKNIFYKMKLFNINKKNHIICYNNKTNNKTNNKIKIKYTKKTIRKNKKNNININNN